MDNSSDPRVPDTLRNIVDLLENISDGLLALDHDFRFIYLNGPAERILGASLDGKVFWDEFPTLKDTVFQTEFQKVLREGIASHFEAFAPGLNAWFSASVHPADEGIAVYLRNITERRTLQEQLRASEERLSTMVDRLPIGAAFRLGDRLILNPAAQRMFQLGPNEVRSIEDWFTVLHGEQAAELMACYEVTTLAHPERVVDTTVQRSDGAMLPIQIIVYRDEKAEVWLIQDLTERVLTEQKFHILFEHSNTAYFLFKDDGIVDCNVAALKQLGYADKSQVVGHSFLSISPPVQADGELSTTKLEGINQELSQQGQCSFEWTHLRPDGAKALVYISVSRFVVNHETLELVVWQDLSTIRETEEKLRQTEDRYRTIIDNTDEIIYTLSLDGDFTFVSQSWTRHLGHEVSDVVGKAFVDFVHPEDRLKGRVYTYRLLKDPDTHRGPVLYRAIHANGSVRWHETTGSVVRDKQGLPIHFVGLSRDVTERREADIALQEATEAALASSRAKSQFLATVSHEIRTPLNGVLGMTNLLSDTPLNKEQRGYLKTIQSSGEILRRVIDDVLDFSRIEAGKLTITPHAIDAVATIQDVVSLFEGQAHEKGIALGLDVAGLKQLPVYADPARIKQVVANLINNAVKFTENGGVHVTVRLARETKTAMILRIEVVDTGIGVQPDRINAIFEGFTQADNSMQRRYGGSGLGLTISKRLTDLMGGNIGVESQPGKGSRFWVELPLAKITLATAKKPAEHEEVSLKGVRVLLAEDNEINIEVAQRQIELLGCIVEVAKNGHEALEMSANFPFNLILMDVQMPEMDGLEATRAIRAREQSTQSHIPIIALTATAFAEDKKACEEAGMDAFLSKPFKREDLESMLKQWA